METRAIEIIKDDFSCERVLGIALDFDGNILHSKYIGLIKAGKTIEAALFFTNKKLINWIIALIEKSEYDRYVLLNGSNRQDKMLNSNLGGENPAYSCFHVLEILFELVKNELAPNKKERFIFDHYLLADSHGNKPCGENFSHILMGDHHYWHDEVVFHDFKDNIIFGHTHHLSNTFPNAKTDYYLVDDTEHILSVIANDAKDTESNFASNKVSVSLFLHKSQQDTFLPETDITLFASFQGMRDPESNYHQCIQHQYTYKKKDHLNSIFQCFQHFFNDVNATISEFSDPHNKYLSAKSLMHFRNHKTKLTKKFMRDRYEDINQDTLSLIQKFRNEFLEMVNLIKQFQSLLIELDTKVNSLVSEKLSHPAKVFIKILNEYISQTYKDAELCMIAKTTAHSETSYISIDNILNTLNNMNAQLKHITFKSDAVADLAIIKQFEKNYKTSAYLDYLYSMRYPLIAGGLNVIAAIILAFYPKPENNVIDDKTRSLGILFLGLTTLVSIFSGSAMVAEQSKPLLFNPTNKKLDSEVNTLIQDALHLRIS